MSPEDCSWIHGSFAENGAAEEELQVYHLRPLAVKICFFCIEQFKVDKLGPDLAGLVDTEAGH